MEPVITGDHIDADVILEKAPPILSDMCNASVSRTMCSTYTRKADGRGNTGGYRLSTSIAKYGLDWRETPGFEVASRGKR